MLQINHKFERKAYGQVGNGMVATFEVDRNEVEFEVDSNGSVYFYMTREDLQKMLDIMDSLEE